MDAVEPLRPRLDDTDERVRLATAEVLGQIRRAAAPAVPDLLAALRDPIAEVRRAVARTLDGMQYETPDMLGALLAGLDDADEGVRAACAEGLFNWGRLFEEHTDAALSRFPTADSVSRRGLIRLLGKSRERRVEVAALLEQVVCNGSDDERVWAATGLGSLGVPTPAVADALLHLFDSTEQSTVVNALCQAGGRRHRRAERTAAASARIASGHPRQLA